MDINAKALERILKEKNLQNAEVGVQIGHSDRYISQVLASGKMAGSAMKLFCLLYGVPESELLPSTDNELSESEKATTYIATFSVRGGGKKLTMNLRDGYGNPLYTTHSLIKDNNHTELMQAISYAAHMAYKLAEQKEMGEAK